VGAVIVRDKRILTTGYNGAPAGSRDCLDLGCLRDRMGIPSGTRHEICRAVRGEQNAVIQAGSHGITGAGGTLYCTHSPCLICAKMVVNAKIRRFVTCQEYPDQEYRELFRETGVVFDVVEKPPLVIQELP